MPAHNQSFPWMSYYRNYKFFEQRMKFHSKVQGINNKNNGLYEISLVDGSILTVFICECYSFGSAEYYESVSKLGELDVVVINSNWCGYSMEAKLICRGRKVGLFNISGFMAALNTPNYWEYLTNNEKEYLKKTGQS